MKGTEPGQPLRLGLVGCGFIAHFHLRALIGVRNVVVTGAYSPTPARRQAFADEARRRDLGDCRVHDSLESLLGADDVDAIWLLCPNHTRLEVMRPLHRMVTSGQSRVFAVACEKPLARTIPEAREMLRLAEEGRLNHGYLENQVFSTAVERGKEIVWHRAVPLTGRPYLARAAEEHAGPHEPWFWRGDLLLEDPDGNEVIIEATTSWSYVGAGLRINLEMLGPEYAMEFSSLNAPLRVFMSRAVRGAEAEDLVEKQNAEQGLMPVLDDEAGIYGYTGENRHMVECFRAGRRPIETFHDGLAVVEWLMALYRSAEEGRVIRPDETDLANFVPAVARSGQDADR